MPAKLTQEEVINQFKEVHGDLYDYSKVNYKGSFDKVIIICKEHGDFKQEPRIHKEKAGCPECNRGFLKSKLTQEQVIKQFKEVHGDLYDYSKVNYKGNFDKVIIICKQHGTFTQIVSNHKLGHGCPQCNRGYKLTQEQVIKQFKEVHGDLYDYSNVNYINTYTKVSIICKQHGVFTQIVSNHKSGQGCPKCRGGYKLTQEQVINQFKEVHGDLYDYSKVEYLGNFNKVTITCKEHGDFKQLPSHHKLGHGCPQCNPFSLHKKYYNKPTIVYFLHIKDNIYKIGITTRPIQERIYELSETLTIKVIRTKQFDTGKQAYEYEQRILNKFKAYRYQGKDILSSGNSELLRLNKD